MQMAAASNKEKINRITNKKKGSACHVPDWEILAQKVCLKVDTK